MGKRRRRRPEKVIIPVQLDEDFAEAICDFIPQMIRLMPHCQSIRDAARHTSNHYAGIVGDDADMARAKHLMLTMGSMFLGGILASDSALASVGYRRADGERWVADDGDES